MVFLIVFVGLFCDAIENGERAQFTDFDRRKPKKASNIDARTDIVALSGVFFDQRRIKSAKTVTSRNVTRQIVTSQT
jgi:hypothetical protein